VVKREILGSKSGVDIADIFESPDAEPHFVVADRVYGYLSSMMRQKRFPVNARRVRAKFGGCDLKRPPGIADSIVGLRSAS
jgi:hypothetical protein